MEEERDSSRLGPWILLPLVLLLVLFFAGYLLPPADCGIGNSGSDPGRISFGIVAGVCSLVAGVAAVARLAAMWRQGDYLDRDVWLGGLALLAIVVGAGIGSRRGGESALGGLLLASLILTVLSLVALVAAAFMRRDTDEAGALVPIYLFGACLTYPLLAWVVLDLNSHPLC